MKNKKILSIIGTILAAILFCMAVYVFVVGYVAKRNNTQPVIFGYSYFVVVSDSMTPEIEVNELIVSKAVDIDSINIGDNVVFVSLSGQWKGYPIVHKVVGKGTSNGQTYLETQGVKQGAPVDADKVTSDNLVGIMVDQNKALGKIVVFFSNTRAVVGLFMLLILVPVIVKLVKHIIKLSKIPQPQEPQDKDSN